MQNGWTYFLENEPKLSLVDCAPSGTLVYMIGSASGYRMGKLSKSVHAHDSHHGRWFLVVTDLDNHPVFSQHGDSGSLVFFKPNNMTIFVPLGIAVARDDDVGTFVEPFDAVNDHLVKILKLGGLQYESAVES